MRRYSYLICLGLLLTVEGHFYKSFPPNAVAPF